MQVPIYYDPMLAKLITYGADREAAIQRMLEAIAMYRVEGVQTTLPFGAFVCRHPAFKSGEFNTHFVKEYYSAELLESHHREEAEIAAATALKLYLEDLNKLRIPTQKPWIRK